MKKRKVMILAEKRANLDLLCDDFQIYGFLNDGVIIRILLHSNTQTNKKIHAAGGSLGRMNNV